MVQLEALKKKYQDYIDHPMNLNISRGIPSKEQLELSTELLSMDLSDNYLSQDPLDIRNYGSLIGIKEARALFAELFEIDIEGVMVGGNSSLQLMYNVLDYYMYHQDNPWIHSKQRKFLCPVPGYDRHWDMLEHFGFELIPIPLTGDGPDMDLVEKLISDDEDIKGIFCVPKYSNPSGEVYSSETIKRLAQAPAAASDFRVLWDNAYVVHHLTDEVIEIDNIIEVSKELNPNRVIMFASTSKMTLPGSGMAAIGTTVDNMNQLIKGFSKQIIGYDKVNQKRLATFLNDKQTVLRHMEKHAQIVAPKFEYILNELNNEFYNNQMITWSRPKGGYFIHITTQDNCADKIVKMLGDIGVVLTPANATYPSSKNEKDNSIRLAPTFATLEELKIAMEAIILCIKIVTLEKDNDKENVK